MRRRAALAALLGLVASVATAPAGASAAPTRSSASPAGGPAVQPIGDGLRGVRLNRVGSFSEPVHVSGAPGFRRLLFVVERAGTVRVLRRGRTLPQPFLDISGLVEDNFVERGLLSIAFPPDYRQSRRFYVYYTGAGGTLTVDEFRRSRSDPFRGLAGSRRNVISIPHPFLNHNGGQLAFHGRELLIGTGDGGSAGDPFNNAQNLDSLLGKLLRIDPRPGGSGRPYSSLGSNPFVGAPGRDEIFSYGLRNPYRFSVQSIVNGPDRIAIGDVGQDRFEEVDYETLPDARGANFGWDAFEGFTPYDCGSPSCPSDGTPDPGGTEAPILSYDHSGRCSVTGGLVVRDRSLRSLYRRYVYADFCDDALRSLVPRLAGEADDRPLGPQLRRVSSFGQTPDGRVYVCSLDGDVYRIVAG